MKVITCTGFGGSGSSAATDFFSEFDNVELVPHYFECTFIHERDGLYDLEKAIEEGHRLKVDLAVKKFLMFSENLQTSEYKRFFNGKFLEHTYNFIENAIGCKWNGWWHRAFELKPLSRKQNFILEETRKKFIDRQISSYELYETDSWRPSYLPYIDEYYECDLEKFRAEAKKYISNLLLELNKQNKEYILIDQLLPPINTESYLHYFDEIKIVIVERDPRDYYLCNNLFWGSRWLPSENLNTYITWYKKTRSNAKESKFVKKIFFEELIYDYEKTSNALLEFSGLQKKYHTNAGKFLVPENSKKNTRLFEKYSNYEDDISIISKELKEYIFDYSKVPEDLLEKIVEKKQITPIINLISECDAYYKNYKIGIKYYIIMCFRLIKKVLKFPFKEVKRLCSKQN